MIALQSRYHSHHRYMNQLTTYEHISLRLLQQQFIERVKSDQNIAYVIKNSIFTHYQGSDLINTRRHRCQHQLNIINLSIYGIEPSFP